MEQGITWAIRFVAGMFATLIVWTTVWTTIAGPGLYVHSRNARLQKFDRQVVRGGIYSRDGQALSVSHKPSEREFVGPLSLVHSVGYVHPRFGKSGLELAYDKELLGLFHETSLIRFWAELTATSWSGWDVITTLDSKLQAAVADAMGDRPGAVVVIDPRDGALRAIYSAPNFDPSRIEEALTPSGQQDLLFNRATLGQYPPGSIFKPVIAAAALEMGYVRPDQQFEDTGQTSIGGRRIVNSGETAHGPLALDDALVLSSNTVFAQLAVEIGADPLITFARKLGLGERPDVPIPAAPGKIPSLMTLDDPAALAAMGIGQSELLVTPLQMAVVVATVANGGWRVVPRFVDGIRSPDGEVRLLRSDPAERVMTPGTAHFLREAMIDVVQRGTGTRAGLANTLVAGKTGTAQVGSGPSHAWFIGFAPARSPQLAVAIVVEHGGYGGAVAAPIAREIFAQIVNKLDRG